MIITVTLNLALDVTYQVPAVDWDGVNRVSAVHRRAGGKGVNVARVLAALGRDVLVTGLAGGPTGQAIEADLRAAGLPSALYAIAGDSRTTLAVSDLPPTQGTQGITCFAP
uniref:Putative sugar kinase n=1 Tax=Nonomuraea gerenzanensis TaxID=93944 RepID=A0A1M4DZX3_9ACTN|nr:PfkB family carbohydrate kinase [Nonomuraea gerenzanensis]SBO92113.1 Putative sugar kinase [Nonomuraea gerenzanensis]